MARTNNNKPRKTKRSTVPRPGKENPLPPLKTAPQVPQAPEPVPKPQVTQAPPAPKPTLPQHVHSIPTPKYEDDDDDDDEVPTDPSKVFIGPYVFFQECKFPTVGEDGKFVYDDKGKLVYKTVITNVIYIYTIKDFWDAINTVSQYRMDKDSYFLQSLRGSETEAVLQECERQCKKRGNFSNLVHDYNKHQPIWVIAKYDPETFDHQDGFYQFLQRYLAFFEARGPIPASEKERTANSTRLNLVERAGKGASFKPMDPDFKEALIPNLVFEFIRGKLEKLGVSAICFSKTVLQGGGRDGTPLYTCEGYQLRIAVGTPVKALAPPNLITKEQAKLFTPQLNALENYIKNELAPRCIFGKIQRC